MSFLLMNIYPKVAETTVLAHIIPNAKILSARHRLEYYYELVY